MKAEQKAMPIQESILPEPHFRGKITYRVGNKVKYIGSSVLDYDLLFLVYLLLET